MDEIDRSLPSLQHLRSRHQPSSSQINSICSIQLLAVKMTLSLKLGGLQSLVYTIDKSAVLYCTVLYYTALHCNVLCYTALYCTALYSTALYYTALLFLVLYCTALHCTVLCYTALNCTVLHYSADRMLTTLEYATGYMLCGKSMLRCTVPLCNLVHSTALHYPAQSQ
jgi:hypothetical protein